MRAYAVPFAAAAVFLMAGCNATTTTSSGTSGSTATSPTPSPSPTVAGTKVDGTDFSITLAEGWTDRTNDQTYLGKLNISQKVFFMATHAVEGKFEANVNDVTANFNVVAIKEGLIKPDQFATYLASAGNHGATNLTPVKTMKVDGEDATYEEYDQDIQGTPGHTWDMVVNHNGKTYNITFTTSAFAFPTQVKVAQAMTSTLKWK
jgi:hypothetical protein